MNKINSDYKLEEIRENLDFIISHLEGQHELFPRTIMTAKIPFQKKIDLETYEQKSKDNIIGFFEESNFIDCRISAFPHNTQHNIDLQIRNKTAPTFIMIDLDQENVKNKDDDMRKKLDKQLEKTLTKMFKLFHGQSNPTVLWTGNGYHIYQPLEPINGKVFEEFEVFYEFLPFLDGVDLTTEFLSFSEKFLSSGNSDPNHNPSIKSCLLRIPGTINSKNNSYVEIIQKWDGKRPHIQYITSYFMSHLIQRRINKINLQRVGQNKSKTKFNETINKIQWIDKLLKTPIDDCRKVVVDLIIVPYLVVVRNFDENTTFDIVRKWLDLYSHLRKVDTDTYQRLKYSINIAIRKQIPPMKIDTIKSNRPELYCLLKKRNVVG